MAAIAATVGALSAPLGIWGAYVFDAPAGPAIVLAAAALFGATSTGAALQHARSSFNRASGSMSAAAQGGRQAAWRATGGGATSAPSGVPSSSSPTSGAAAARRR